MKTFNEIINQTPVYINDWSSKEDVVRDFEGYFFDEEKLEKTLKDYEDVNILLASYGQANYSGEAWVLFEQNGKLYEVNGGHCSCYGLEGQWSEEEVLLEELEHRLLNGTFGEDDWSDNNFKEELCEFLGVKYVKNLDKSYY